MDFDAEDGEQRVYSTRSKVNISDAAMEDLEQLFVPPDITPDMYDVPTENVDEAPEIQAQLDVIAALEAKYEAIGS